MRSGGRSPGDLTQTQLFGEPPRTESSVPDFGGGWTQDKLAYLDAYLGVYTTALRDKFSLHYFDAFAGTGRYTANDGIEREGSARIALRHPFASYLLVEQHPARYARLRDLTDEPQMRARRWAVINGDGNSEALRFCEGLGRNDRAVAFLDPFGLQVEWRTLQAIRATEAIDAWYLFPTSGVARQMTLNPARRDEAKDAALDRVYGTAAWRDDLYASGNNSLFGDSVELQRVNSEAIREWTMGRLRGLFPAVRRAAALRRGATGNRFGGPMLFDLYFLCSNPSPKAIALADKLVRGITHAIERQRISSDGVR